MLSITYNMYVRNLPFSIEDHQIVYWYHLWKEKTKTIYSLARLTLLIKQAGRTINIGSINIVSTRMNSASHMLLLQRKKLTIPLTIIRKINDQSLPKISSANGSPLNPLTFVLNN